MTAIIQARGVTKTYENGHSALKGVALLGPNGAGKTTLISLICGLVGPSSGHVSVGGHDIIKDYRAARRMIGLVPQEITIEPFSTVMETTRMTRGLFGKPANDAYIEELLTSLSLFDKRNQKNVTLSGGMKRRVLIAKALSHEPDILFLDEPTAGVDVELRKDMWALVEKLRAKGTTIILTTHYIEEAEEIADRIAVINDGEIILVEAKDKLMAKMGKKELLIELPRALEAIPAELAGQNLSLSADGMQLTYAYDSRAERTGIRKLLNDLDSVGLNAQDVSTRQSSLEDIFVNLVRKDAS